MKYDTAFRAWAFARRALSWDKVSGADAYRVYKYDSSADKFKTYKNVSSTSCKVTELSAGTTYKFKIAALVKSGNSYKVQTKTGAVSVKTTVEALLPAPENLTAKPDEKNLGGIEMQWDEVKGADGYIFFYYNNNTNKWENIKNTGTIVYGNNISLKEYDEKRKVYYMSVYISGLYGLKITLPIN